MFNTRLFLPGFMVFLCFLGCIVNSAVQAQESVTVPEHTLWSELLNRYVISTPGGHAIQVDYAGFASAQVSLDSYLQLLSTVDQHSFDQWDKQDQLAFLINAYNAWTVKLILKNHNSIQSIKDLGSLFQSPWKKEFIPLLGKTRSLDDIEHGLICGSGRYNEPRVHFAANCASIGCPALREEAYRGAKLEAQLEQQAERFISDRTRNRAEEKSVKVSAIFKWYRDDFAAGWRGAQSLADFLALYAKPLGLSEAQIKQLQQGELEIKFLDYDWQLNRK